MENNMKFTRLLLCLMWLSIGLIGCLRSENLPSSDLATATLQISHTPSPLSPIVSSATNTLSITPTFSVPTVFPETSAAYLLLQKHLKNAPPCQLPCWGSVTPGVSTASEAEEEFMKLRTISSPSFTYFGTSLDIWYVGSLNIFYPLLNTQVHVSPGFVARSDDMTVVLINVYTQSIPYQNSGGRHYGDKEYNTLLSAYTISQIFSTYGLPNLIYTRAKVLKGEETAPDFFFVRLLYLDLGIYIRYRMLMEEKGNVFQFCPSESQIDLDLTSSGVGDTYEEFFRQLGAEEWTSLQESHYLLLEDALDMTNEEFSKAIISSPETCFETPINIWPEP
jgi:hypothetical protein